MIINPRSKTEGPIAFESPWGGKHHFDELILGSSEYLTRKLSTWQRKDFALRELFGSRLNELDEKRRSVSHACGERTIVFLSYENHWAKAGGLSAVANLQVDELLEAGEKVLRLSPLHKGLESKPHMENKTPIANCRVPFDGREVEVSIYKVTTPGLPAREWYLFSAPGFFEMDGGSTHTDPYFDSHEQESDEKGAESRLLRDSLFASKAVPYVLAALKIKKDVVVHANEWQFISTALTMKEAMLDDLSDGSRKDSMIKSAVVTFTMHNPYDHYLPAHKLAMITDMIHTDGWYDSRWPPIGANERITMFSCMAPLLDCPLMTVSRSFAEEMLFHPLLTHYYMPHLQDIVAYQGVVGINNGTFIPADRCFLSQEAMLDVIQHGNIDKIKTEKLAARRKALEILSGKQEGAIGELWGATPGSDVRTLPDSIPTFIIWGRFDIGQKGIDVGVDVVRKMFDGIGRYIFIAWPGVMNEVMHKHLELVEQLVKEKPGEVIFYPRRHDRFNELLAGVNFNVSPSIYEPFGSISEPLVKGTPLIATLTGGHLSQLFLEMQGNRGITGFIETPSKSTSVRDQIVSLQQAQFPEDRRKQVLFHEKSKVLSAAMVEQAFLYKTEQDEYYRSLATLDRIPLNLRWSDNTAQYDMMYRLASAV